MNITQVLSELRTERARLDKAIAALSGLNGSVSAVDKVKRTMSAAGRAKIAAAQRKRWAKVKAGKKA